MPEFSHEKRQDSTRKNAPRHDESVATDDEDLLQQHTQNPTALNARTVMALQRTIGNAAVQRLVVEQHAAADSVQRITYKKDKFDQFLSWAVKGMAKGATFGKGSKRREIGTSSETMEQFGNMFNRVQDVTVPNGKHNLTGRYYESSGGSGKYAGRTILFLSGSGGSAEDYSAPVAQFYCEQGANLVAVNYRGFGGSYYEKEKLVGSGTEKKHSTRKDLSAETFHSDARAIFDWVVANIENLPANIVVLGYSLGGPVAAGLVKELSEEDIAVGGLILHSAMDSIRETAIRESGEYGGNVGADAVGTEMNTAEILQGLAQIPGFEDLPIMFMSGSGDEEHLDLGTTRLHDIARQAGFTNVFDREGLGGHTDSAEHFASWVVRELDKFMALTGTGG